MVEVLDIDSLVQNFGTGQKIETELRISSPELLEENDYEIHVWTDTRMGTEPLPFTLPIIQETPEPAPIGIPKDVEEQEKLLESEIIPETKEIPKWIKDIFTFYSEDLINDEELVSALQFLIRSGIIQI